MITQEKLEELVNALSKEIREWELKVVSERSSSSYTSVAPKSYRKNQRTEEALRNFNHAISWFLKEIDKHIRKVPNHELMVQLRSGYYSKKTEGKGQGKKPMLFSQRSYTVPACAFAGPHATATASL